MECHLQGRGARKHRPSFFPGTSFCPIRNSFPDTGSRLPRRTNSPPFPPRKKKVFHEAVLDEILKNASPPAGEIGEASSAKWVIVQSGPETSQRSIASISINALIDLSPQGEAPKNHAENRQKRPVTAKPHR